MRILTSIVLTIFLSVSAYAVNYKKVNVDNKNSEYKIPNFVQGMGLAEAYFRQLPKKMNKKEWNNIILKMKSDKNFIKANNYLYNKRFQILKKDVYDPEFHGIGKTILVPNYPKALEFFTKSVEKTKSTISAYEGLMIIKSFLGKKYKNNKVLAKKFTLILYRNNTCEGLYSMGKSFLYGTKYIQKNPKKAKEIFIKGLKECNNISYYGTIFTSKILTANIYLKEQKSNK